MENILYILVPKNTRVGIYSDKICLDEKPTDVEVKFGGSELLRFMHKNSNYNFDLFYIEKCKIENKKVVPAVAGEHTMPSVLVCAKAKIATDEYNYYFLDRTNNTRCCLFIPNNSKVEFQIGEDSPINLGFNTYTAQLLQM